MQVCCQLRDWCLDHTDNVKWGGGKLDGSLVAQVQGGGTTQNLFTVCSNSGLEINFEYVKNKEPFVDEQLRRELLGRLNAVPGIQISADRIGKRPKITYQSLQEDQLREGFCAVMDWAISMIREAG